MRQSPGASWSQAESPTWLCPRDCTHSRPESCLCWTREGDKVFFQCLLNNLPDTIRCLWLDHARLHTSFDWLVGKDYQGPDRDMFSVYRNIEQAPAVTEQCADPDKWRQSDPASQSEPGMRSSHPIRGREWLQTAMTGEKCAQSPPSGLARPRQIMQQSADSAAWPRPAECGRMWHTRPRPTRHCTQTPPSHPEVYKIRPKSRKL